MKTENEEIGELIQEIGLNFQIQIFKRWKIEKVVLADEVTDLSPLPSSPVQYVSIQSNELRASPELNSRLLKAGNLIEALRKAAAVAKYIIDTSKPIH